MYGSPVKRWTATSLASHDLPIEVRITDHVLEPPRPKRHHHFRSTRSGDVTDINNVVGLPAKPIVHVLSDLFLCHRIVAADEQIVIARDTRRFNHNIANYGIKRFHDTPPRESFLNPFPE